MNIEDRYLFNHLYLSYFMKKNENKSWISESYVIGIIGLVFLIIGYQIALFIHHSAITRIAANRDSPDTVFIYVSSDTSSRNTIKPNKVVRKNAVHPPRIEAIRENLPRKVETFVFDPNTASIDDLYRLGFSQKQAQAIDNYRQKGGRFRRKEDFAKSFVVSDSVYRRLEKYIDIPLLDLNLADSAAFDALPGIGGWFASKMVEHRTRLCGYSYKEQLLDIYRFDQEKFDALSDLIQVSQEHITPYPLWTLPADSLRLHPYIDNYETAKAIVLYRKTTPSEQWTIADLSNAGILTAEAAMRLSKCIIEEQ